MSSPVFKKRIITEAKKELRKEGDKRVEKVKRQAEARIKEVRAKEADKRKEIKAQVKEAKSFKSVIKHMISQVPHRGEISEDILATIMEIEDQEGRQMTRQQLMVHALIGRAMQGNVDAFRELLDRTEGKVANRNENKNLNVTYEDWLKQQASDPMTGEPEDEEE